MSIIEEIKKKREISDLPDSIIERVAEQNKGDVKKSRAVLRKYFGVFMTNKILKGNLNNEEMLKSHISSSKRDYEKFYKSIFEGINGINSVIDLGCGANGFSYKYLKKEIVSIDYVGIEASGRLVNQMNKYFEDKLYLAHAVQEDLFDIENILQILRRQEKKRAVFLFQVIGALESLERDFAKEFIKEVFSECELMVITWSKVSLSGRKKFFTKKKWLMKFLEENYNIDKDFEKYEERILVLTK
jgi:hypothetical protein